MASSCARICGRPLSSAGDLPDGGANVDSSASSAVDAAAATVAARETPRKEHRQNTGAAV
ncbi:hypothetical protein A1351_17925 [Methylosinus sp. R-45379]|nr:hypothetical protein A1351_17925 [Methylosinus sp. R-45379]